MTCHRCGDAGFILGRDYKRGACPNCPQGAAWLAERLGDACKGCGYAPGSLGCDSVCGVVVVPTEAWDSARRVEKALAGIPRPQAIVPLEQVEPGSGGPSVLAGFPRDSMLDGLVDYVNTLGTVTNRAPIAASSRARAFCDQVSQLDPVAAVAAVTHEARIEQVRAHAAERIAAHELRYQRRADQAAADCLRAANLASVQKQLRRRGDAQAQRLASFAVSLVLLGVALVVALGAADAVGALR